MVRIFAPSTKLQNGKERLPPTSQRGTPLTTPYRSMEELAEAYQSVCDTWGFARMAHVFEGILSAQEQWFLAWLVDYLFHRLRAKKRILDKTHGYFYFDHALAAKRGMISTTTITRMVDRFADMGLLDWYLRYYTKDGGRRCHKMIRLHFGTMQTIAKQQREAQRKLKEEMEAYPSDWFTDDQ